jgi:O-antigen ligase
VLWERGWQDFAAWPVFGVGFEKGAFVGWEVLRNVFANMYHNVFVQFAAAMGILGIGAFGVHLWQVGRLFRKPKGKTVLLLTLPVMILMMSLVDNFFFYLNQQIAYCMFLAVAEAERHKK